MIHLHALGFIMVVSWVASILSETGYFSIWRSGVGNIILHFLYIFTYNVIQVRSHQQLKTEIVLNNAFFINTITHNFVGQT